MRNIAQNDQSGKWFDGREKWPEKKRIAEEIGIKLSQLPKKYHKRAERITQCGHQLETRSCPEHDGHYHAVTRAILCKDRACPICNWRRGRVYAAKLDRAIERAGGRYLLLTLTIPNVPHGGLEVARKRVTKSFGSMMRDDRLRGVVGGYYRALEITHNGAAGTWHPHIHAILRVEESYFRSALYLEKNDWAALWRHHYGDPTISDAAQSVSALQPSEVAQGIAEVTKYSTKPDALIGLHLDELEEYLESMKYARLTETAGCLRIKDATIDDELIHREDEETLAACPVCGARLQKYNWTWSDRDHKYVRTLHRVNWPMRNAEIDRLRRTAREKQKKRTEATT